MSTDKDLQASDETPETLEETIRNAVENPEAEVPEEIQDAAAEETAGEVIGEPPLSAPPKWDKRYKEVFDAFGSVEKGRDWQKAWIDFYNEQQGYSTKIEQERAELRRFAEPLHAAIEPYRQMIAMAGTTPDVFVRQAMGLAMALTQNPRETILGLAKRAGLDLNQLVQDQPYVDPQVQNLQERYRRLEDQLRQREERQAHEFVVRAQAETEQQLKSFTEAKNDNGELLHPHLELVQGQMAELIHGREAQRRYDPSLSSMTLDEAYERACKLSPEVAQAEASQKAAKEAAARAAKAKKESSAAKRVTGKVSRSEPQSEETLEDEIRKALRAQQAA